MEPAHEAAVFELKQELDKTGGDITKAIERLQRRRADVLIAQAIQRSRCGENDWDSLVHGLGRAHFPSLLVMVWDRPLLDQRIKAIGEAWTSPEHPERALRRAELAADVRHTRLH